jgi:hypothetical protein
LFDSVTYLEDCFTHFTETTSEVEILEVVSLKDKQWLILEHDWDQFTEQGWQTDHEVAGCIELRIGEATVSNNVQ